MPRTNYVEVVNQELGTTACFETILGNMCTRAKTSRKEITMQVKVSIDLRLILHQESDEVLYIR